ncbi:MAG: hypothetical protein DRI94_13900 [Bacteroidetes bacterium]|nr:MAG: hypothetical protein DRI94_13900 [Bacteroidota bacterium]
MNFISIVIYLVIGVIVLVVRVNKTKKLNEQKRLARIAAAKKAGQQNNQQVEPVITQQSVKNEKISQRQLEKLIQKSQNIIKDDMHRDIVDYDKIAMDPNIDLIPDESVHVEHKEEKTFFEQNFNEKFDLKKAVIYSEIMNRKY